MTIPVHIYISNINIQNKNIKYPFIDYAGKTTILHTLQLGEIITTIPTIGFNIETLDYKNILFTSWDSGGYNIRPLLRHFYQYTAGIIYVVDSTDKDRIDDKDGADNSAKEMLHRTLAEDQLLDVPVLIFANKQDIPSAMSVNEVAERLCLYQLRARQWKIQGTCGIMGDGIYDGLDWKPGEVKIDIKNLLSVY